MPWVLSFILLCLLTTPAVSNESDRFESFRRTASLGLEPLLLHVFAEHSAIQMIEDTDADNALRFDLDDDGIVDALAWREGTTFVAAIDEDSDFDADDPRPDRDSDCYVADLNSDGVIDRIVDYTDEDGDNDPDRQDLYEVTKGPLGTDGVGVTIVLDLDDDNRLFHTTGYTYHANHDMWQSDFDGDGMFIAARRDEETGKWSSIYENPFCFYDNDGDGWSDEALRLEGTDLQLQTLRWSFDADGDSKTQEDRDYDFSLTAHGPVNAPVAVADSLIMRDGNSVHFVSWQHAREFARWALWRSVLLVWDENDHNVAPYSQNPERERWEGVIADRYLTSQPVGGPSCGRINKRYELDADGSGRMQLYWSDIDSRVHLSGAEVGELVVDLPSDRSVERLIQTEDKSGNGHFDTWTWSVPRQPGRTRTVSLDDEEVHGIALDAESLRAFWIERFRAARDQSKLDRDQLEKAILMREPTEMRSWWNRARDSNHPIAARAARSSETERLLIDLQLWDLGGGFLSRDPESSDADAAWRLPSSIESGSAVEIDPAQMPLEARRHLSSQGIVELVTEEQPRIAGQVEDIDGDGTIDMIYFPQVPFESTEPPIIEINPASPLPRREQVRVDPWFGTGIAFESARVAYRAYNGIVDLFIKKQHRLVLRGDLGNYHEPQPWGLDALTVGDGPGIGGLYIRKDCRWWPLFGAERVKSQRVIVDGPLRSIVEVNLANDDVRVRRTYRLNGNGDAIVDELVIDAAVPWTLAAALPPLDAQGEIEGIPGVWSHGVSVPGAGAIGVAGAMMSSSKAKPATIDGRPALQFRLKPSESIRIAWVAGGQVYGDSTSQHWLERATRILTEHSEAHTTRN